MLPDKGRPWVDLDCLTPGIECLTLLARCLKCGGVAQERRFPARESVQEYVQWLDRLVETTETEERGCLGIEHFCIAGEVLAGFLKQNQSSLQNGRVHGEALHQRQSEVTRHLLVAFFDHLGVERSDLAACPRCQRLRLARSNDPMVGAGSMDDVGGLKARHMAGDAAI